MKTVAHLSSRTYVPYGWIALEYCSLKFTGHEADSYNSDWHEIEFSDVKKYGALAREAGDKISKLQTARNELSWWNFGSRRTINRQIMKLSTTQEDYSDRRFKDASTLKSEAKNFLADRGFFEVNGWSSGGECETEHIIYEKNEDILTLPPLPTPTN